MALPNKGTSMVVELVEIARCQSLDVQVVLVATDGTGGAESGRYSIESRPQGGVMHPTATNHHDYRLSCWLATPIIIEKECRGSCRN
jgi:hypothetical protein